MILIRLIYYSAVTNMTKTSVNQMVPILFSDILHKTNIDRFVVTSMQITKQLQTISCVYISSVYVVLAITCTGIRYFICITSYRKQGRHPGLVNQY
jgi:hypothetical protein